MARRGKRQKINASLEIKKFMVGKAGLAAYIPAYKARCEDFGPIWDDVMQALFHQEDFIFMMEGAVDGRQGWPTVEAYRYKAWKAEHFPGRGPMVLTGKLRDQLTGQSGDHFEQRGKQSITFGSNYPVAMSSGRTYGWDSGPDRLPYSLDASDRWSTEAGNEDVAGVHAAGEAVLNDAGRMVDVLERETIIPVTVYIDRIADLAVDHATDTQVS